MTQVIDAEGRLQLPSGFHPGDSVELEVVGHDKVVVRRTREFSPTDVRLEKRPDGSTVIVGLPPVDNETVRKLLEDFP